MSSALLAALVAEAAARPGEEVCGLLLGRGSTVMSALPCRNVSPEPARAFEIDPAQLLAAHRAARAGGPAVIGHYHSHPTGDPTASATDRAMAAGDGAWWVILAGDAAGAWVSRAPGTLECAPLTLPDDAPLAPGASDRH